MAASSAGDPSHNLLTAVKRAQVKGACQECRKRKGKCDGRRPCQPCTARGLACTYTVNEGENQQQATKRKYAELAESHGPLVHLYQTLVNADEETAQEVFRRIRNGEHVTELIKRPRDSRPAQSFPTNTSVDSVSARLFLLLAQSVAPLQTIVHIADLVQRQGKKVVFASDPLNLRQIDSTIKLEFLADVLDDVRLPVPGSVQVGRFRLSASGPAPEGSYDGPLYFVPARPWTQLPVSDVSVSHLVSIFLTFINSYWRQVEEDLFLEAMRSQDLKSPLCSPFLVNAILAVASQLSGIGAAFASADLVTRGRHFHEEALRLWYAESHAATTSNIQGLLTLSLDASLRGRDKLGFDLVQTAASLNKRLDSPTGLQESAQSLRGLARARSSAALTTVAMNLTFTLGLLLPPDSLAVALSDARDPDTFLSYTSAPWTGYPLYNETVPHSPNLLVRARWKLTEYTYELVHLLFGTRCFQDDKHELYTAVSTLASKVQQWYENLPRELCYFKTMPTCLYELHGHYHCFQMVLHSRALDALSQNETGDVHNTFDDGPDGFADKVRDLRTTALQYALAATETIYDYRVRYGLKIILAYQIQPATIAANLFLRSMHSGWDRDGFRPVSITSGLDRYTNVDLAFEECFRYLLASGMQQMLPRAIARMLYHTARQLQVPLPFLVTSAIQSMSKTSWHASEVRMLESIYPNYATEEDTLENMLRKWETSLEDGEGEAVPAPQ